MTYIGLCSRMTYKLCRMPYFDRWLDEKLRDVGTITYLAESPVCPGTENSESPAFSTTGIVPDPSRLLAVGFIVQHKK
jgi:hypothetical protein